MIPKYLTAFCAALILSTAVSDVQAQTEADTKTKNDLKLNPPKKFYMGSGLDAGIFSTGIVKKGASDAIFTTVRFSYVLNFGVNFNYDATNLFGVFAGVGVKNIGFIEHPGGVTVKRRVYTIGVPVGIKIGNLGKRNYGFIGGGVDLPFNYKEKAFTDRSNKNKFNEWFSDRTPQLMPYVFVGASIKPGMTYKIQYYPGNFLNTSFSELSNGIPVRPYAGYDVQLLMLSVGFDLHYKRWPKPVYVKDNDKDDDNENED